MARIPENEIERLKREISVQRLAEARGIKLTKQGADLLGKCPFHNDRTPSLVITPAKNLWHCLGACGRGGDVIEWVMLANGISFRHAVELLRKDHLPLAASPIKPVKVGTVRVLPAPVAADADDHALLNTIVGFYQETLKQSPEAQRYLEGRGLKSAEMVERFRLGFANRTLGYRLEAKNRAGGAAVRGRLQKLGIYRESGHEHFNGSLVIPVFHAGEVVEMYGRKITPNLREGTSGAAAKDKYELPVAPTHSATVPADRVKNLGPAPDGRSTTSGGGSQAATPHPIPIKPGEIKPLNQ